MATKYSVSKDIEWKNGEIWELEDTEYYFADEIWDTIKEFLLHKNDNYNRLRILRYGFFQKYEYNKDDIRCQVPYKLRNRQRNGIKVNWWNLCQIKECKEMCREELKEKINNANMFAIRYIHKNRNGGLYWDDNITLEYANEIKEYLYTAKKHLKN